MTDLSRPLTTLIELQPQVEFRIVARVVKGKWFERYETISRSLAKHHRPAHYFARHLLYLNTDDISHYRKLSGWMAIWILKGRRNHRSVRSFEIYVLNPSSFVKLRPLHMCTFMLELRTDQ